MADLNLLKIIVGGKTFAIPEASQTQKGLMTPDMYLKLQSAEANKIDAIQINGNAVAAVGKVVNLLLAQGEADGSIKLGDAEILVKGLSALAFKANVSKADLETTLANLIEQIPTLKSAVDTLNGEEAGSVKKMIDDKFKTWTELTTDNQKVDTFMEMVNWIESHGTETAGFQKSITALEALMKGIGGEEEPKTVMEAIQQALGGFDLSNYYTKTEADNTFVKKDGDKVLSTNDFTNDLKQKLDSLQKIEYSYDAESATLTIEGVAEKAAS